MNCLDLCCVVDHSKMVVKHVYCSMICLPEYLEILVMQSPSTAISLFIFMN